MNRRKLTSRQALEGRKKKPNCEKSARGQSDRRHGFKQALASLGLAWLGWARVVLAWLGLCRVGFASPLPNKSAQQPRGTKNKTVCQLCGNAALLLRMPWLQSSTHDWVHGWLRDQGWFFTTTKLNTKCWPKVLNETLPATGPNQT